MGTWQWKYEHGNDAGAGTGPPVSSRRRAIVISKNQEQRAEFEGRFSRCRNSLYFLAWGALGSAGEAEQAMENCYRKARSQPKRFVSDGEFGGWMIRLLINEIVLVANRRLPDVNELSETECLEAGSITAQA
jgi:DNA-directed RNA polymerase specialized sigma24 family protein